MKIPYIPHLFGERVEQMLHSRQGWLTAAVTSSVPWPLHDVWVQYGGDDYVLRGTVQPTFAAPPCITVPCDLNQVDEALARVYRFSSILGWFQHGYVDVTGYITGSHPMLYSRLEDSPSINCSGKKSFNCNHMPLVEEENVRIALACWREGQRLSRVHDSYAFLSFYKVIESQFTDSESGKKAKTAWIGKNIEQLTGEAAARVTELRNAGIDVSKHIFKSGRCAVAHASLQGQIIDPDIPADRRRLTADLDIMRELAQRYIQYELGVPNSSTLYRTRDRLSPWDSLLPAATLAELRSGGTPTDLSGLDGRVVSVGIWPDGPIPRLEQMTIQVEAVQDGVVQIILFNPQMTVILVFKLDYRSGLIDTILEAGGLRYAENEPDESDVLAYATYFYNVLGNGIAELTCDGLEPVDCVVVIPVNIIPPNPETAIAETVTRYRQHLAAANNSSAKVGPD